MAVGKSIKNMMPRCLHELKSLLLQHPHRAQAWDTNPKKLKVQKRQVTIA